MLKIEADPDLMEQVASNIARIADDMDAQARALAATGDQTAAAWRSAYTGAYLDSVERVRRGIATAAGNARAAANALRQSAADIRHAEESVSRTTAIRR